MDIVRNEPLGPRTSFKIGGPADYFCVARTPDELREAISFAAGKKVPVTVLGGGTNVLVADAGIRGLVVVPEFLRITWRDLGEGEVVAEVSAGLPWDDFVAEAVRRGLWGVENLSGIPGSVGAAPIQNIGAYGAEAKDTVVRVEAVHRVSGAARSFDLSACQFEYRDSFFKTPTGRDFIITRVVFRLCKTGNPKLSYRDLSERFAGRRAEKLSLHEVRRAVIGIRKTKFPPIRKVGTAGSFFKNPIITRRRYENLLRKFPELPSHPAGKNHVKIPLAWILDRVLRLRGAREGKVELHHSQPIVLVNLGGATAKEVASFARGIQRRVFDVTGIEVDWEVQYLGDF